IVRSLKRSKSRWSAGASSGLISRTETAVPSAKVKVLCSVHSSIIFSSPSSRDASEEMGREEGPCETRPLLHLQEALRKPGVAPHDTLLWASTRCYVQYTHRHIV